MASLALNPQYDAIGKGFVQQYYALFDDPAQRPNLANMYNVSLPYLIMLSSTFFSFLSEDTSYTYPLPSILKLCLHNRQNGLGWYRAGSSSEGLVWSTISF